MQSPKQDMVYSTSVIMHGQFFLRIIRVCMLYSHVLQFDAFLMEGTRLCSSISYSKWVINREKE